MKKQVKRLTVCTAAAVFTLTAGMTAMASSDNAFSIDMSSGSDEAWSNIAMTNDDTVSTGANIRSAASEDGEVVGCLYRGGAVEVLYKGDEWSEVRSGDVQGFIKNEYLVYGTEAKGLADYYGDDGVETSWNDVYVFDNPDACADIVHTAADGESFAVVSDQGHWLGVQLGADQMAYVSSEDVDRVLLVDTAVPMDESSSGESDTWTEDSYSEDTSYDASYDESYDETYYDDSAYQESYDDSYYGDTSYDESYDNTYYEDTTYDGSYDDTYYGDTSYDESYDDTYYDDTAYDESYDDTYYEDTTYDDTYSDGSDGYVENVDGADEYVEDTSSGYDDGYTEPEYTEPEYTETEYTEPEYTETEYTEPEYTETESTEASSSVSSSDLDLLAAIIYCEAGNQPYDGMVAVGAVVMNRVASPSFPNTISEVIYQSGQFTPASSGTLASALASGVPSTCYDAASAALAGENPVGSALYFNTGVGKGLQIGDHWFY